MFGFLYTEYKRGADPKGFAVGYMEQGNADQTEKDFAMTKKMASVVCGHVAAAGIAAVDVQFSGPAVQEIAKNMRVTFPDMLGTVGRTTWERD